MFLCICKQVQLEDCIAALQTDANIASYQLISSDEENHSKIHNIQKPVIKSFKALSCILEAKISKHVSMTMNPTLIAMHQIFLTGLELGT